MIDKLICLDIDGVVNNHQWSYEGRMGAIAPELMARLNRILLETQAKIVITSSWRRVINDGDMTPRGFGFLLRTHGMASNEVVGCTKRSSEISNRGWEIEDWLQAHGRPRRYLVLDDMDLSRMHPAVVVDGRIGLTDEDVEKAIAILNGG